KNIGLTMSPEVIKDYVWEDKDVCDNTLRTQIKKIREKLGENFIINVRNIGYKIEKYDRI
ncbi:MAG: helix-turn-helix domain-containing protein, partial [Campylobacter curvus]